MHLSVCALSNSSCTTDTVPQVSKVLSIVQYISVRVVMRQYGKCYTLLWMNNPLCYQCNIRILYTLVWYFIINVMQILKDTNHPLLYQSRGMENKQESGLELQCLAVHPGGEPFHIIGGSIHYFRVPRAYWGEGLWHQHTYYVCAMESVPTRERSLQLPHSAWFGSLHLSCCWIGIVGDFTSRVVHILWAADLLSGLLSWLLQEDSMRLRMTYPGFIQAVSTFFDKLIQKVIPL